MLLTKSVFAEISGHQAKLSAHFEDITLETALGEIVDSTGIEIITSQSLDKKINFSFSDITAEKLLKRLLHGYNAVYLKEPQTKNITQVRIFSNGNPVSSKVGKTTPSLSKPITEAKENNNKFYMPITLNGQTIEMLIDTGATTLALSQNMANMLGLTTGESTPINTANGTVNGYRTIVEDIDMAGKNLKGVQAVVLPHLSEAGLIGQNILAHFTRITENGTMRFEPLGRKNNPQPIASDTDNTAIENKKTIK